MAKKGRADYVMFCRLTPLASVEAKENADVAGEILQAERYSKGFKIMSSQDRRMGARRPNYCMGG